MDKPLVNRVASSGIVNIDLAQYFPSQEFAEFDIADYLFKALILREKDFRMALKEYDWSTLEGKTLCVYCSSDAIIPMWSYMLIASYANDVALDVYSGTKPDYIKNHYKSVIAKMDTTEWANSIVIVKGCSDKDVPPSAYLNITLLLKPIVKSLMFGEACSAVPIYKKPRK